VACCPAADADPATRTLIPCVWHSIRSASPGMRALQNLIDKIKNCDYLLAESNITIGAHA
jgi:hypothetical protein